MCFFFNFSAGVDAKIHCGLPQAFLSGCTKKNSGTNLNAWVEKSTVKEKSVLPRNRTHTMTWASS